MKAECEKGEAIVQPQTAAQGRDGLLRTCWKGQKKMVIINDLFLSYWTVRLIDKAQDTAKNGTSCCGSLHVKCTVLRNESQGESRKRVEKSLLDTFIKVMFKDSEKPRLEQKPSEPKAKKIQTKRKNRRKLFWVALIILSRQKMPFLWSLLHASTV